MNNEEKWIEGWQPLRLTPFERYMVCDDRGASCPMSIPAQWVVRGTPERTAFDESYRTALSWHPLLLCLIKGNVWQMDARASMPVKFFEEGEEPSAGDRKIDLIDGPVMRCSVIDQGMVDGYPQTVIEFVTHHAVTDGVSLAEFFGDVVANYAKIMSNNDCSVLRKPTASSLINRGIVDRHLPEPVLRTTAFKFVVKETAKFFIRRAESVAPRLDNHDTNQATTITWRMVDCLIDSTTTKSILRSAQALGATVNDWSTVAMLNAIARWNDERSTGQRSPDGWLIANMPVLMRGRSAARTSAANMIGYAFLARKRYQLVDFRQSVVSIAEESRQIQKWKIAAMFLDGVSAVGRVPGGLRFCTRITQPASCVISNLGDPSRRFRNKLSIDADGFPSAGNLSIRRLTAAAPVRPGTHVAGLISMLGGQLNLSLRVLPSRFSPQAASELIERWKDEMIQHL